MRAATRERPHGPVASLLEVGTPSNRLLRIALLTIWSLLLLKALYTLVFVYPFGVDLEIPLRAAQRWVDGGQPYLPFAFAADPGATQPFLYPPFILPFMAALLQVPRVPLGVVWFGILVGAAFYTCRRLAIPIRWWPFVLAWPPFAEGLVAGNVQVLLFAAFVTLFWASSRDELPFQPIGRDVADRSSPPARDGLLSASIGALKVSQFQPWLFVLRHRWPAAVVGALAVLGVVALTLPITGLTIWGDWVEQMRRAATAASWENRGFAISRFTPPGVGVAVTLVTLVVLLRISSRERAGEWVGVLSVVGAVSLHIFGLLFLLPAMLVIRRELAIVGALFITTYSYLGLWAGIVVVSASFVASRHRTWLEEPTSLRLGDQV